MIRSYHLPALPDVATTEWSYGSAGAAVQLRMAQLTPEQLAGQAESLIEARARHLADRPVAAIVEAVDAVAARLIDPDDPLRRAAESALPLVTGYSAPMVVEVLDRMAADWRAPALERLLAAEFADPGVLDGFRARRGGGRVRAYGPRLTTHVFSGNVPGVAVTSLIRSLLVKSAALGKTAAGEPLLAALFAQGLAEHDAGLGACVAVTYWPGGNEAMESVALGRADAVIAYGGDDAVAGVRERTPPHARFLGYGHKLSLGLVAREALEADAAGLAERAALDVSTFDQQGCVSPHLFFVEDGGPTGAREWARDLAAAMAATERRLPRGALSPREASAIRQQRGEAEFARLGGGDIELHASEPGTAWTVIVDPDPDFAASCLNRLVRVKPVARLEDAVHGLGALGPHLQTVGIAAGAERTAALAEALGRIGASRIAPIGRMAWPPPAWHHDGRPPLRELVRWCDLEEPDA